MDRDEDEIYALLRQLDHPPPRVTAEMIAARARRGGGDGRRWAAGILLASTLAGAAYAAPGSPVRGWITAAVERVAGRAETRPAPLAAPAEQQPVSQPGASGIAVAPGRQLLILFASPQAAGQARVELTDAAEVVVRASSGGASFTSGIDRLVIDNQGSSGDFEIQIPRAARRVEIRVAGERIFLKSGPRITLGDSMPSPGSYPLPLTRLEP